MKQKKILYSLILLTLLSSVAATPYYWYEGTENIITINETHGFIIAVKNIAQDSAYILVNNLSAGTAHIDEWQKYPDRSEIRITEIYNQEGDRDLIKAYFVPGTPILLKKEIEENTTADVFPEQVIIDESIPKESITVQPLSLWERIITFFRMLFG